MAKPTRGAALPPELVARLGRLVRRSKSSGGPVRRFKLSADRIQATLSNSELLTHVHAIIDGKPVPHTIDPQDGCPPVTVKLPLRKRPPAGKPGRPPRFSVEEYLNLPGRTRKFGERSLAKVLNAQLRKKHGPGHPAITREVVRRLRKEARALQSPPP
jgi:hypothetical protein